MNIALLIIVFLHGLIHLLGFVKGFGLKELPELRFPVSKTMGLVWFKATLLFVLYGILHLMDNQYAWLFGFIAVILSQLLIILFWKDAKFGTLPNILILLAASISYADYRFQHQVQDEVAELLRQSSGVQQRVLSQEHITALPKPVQQWLLHSGAVGKPFVRIGKVLQQAEMKMKPDQQEWMSASAVQYSTFDAPAFVWMVHGRMNSLLSFQGRDKFQDGAGEMLIKLHSLINVVNERGEKLNESTMQRYLGEMLWFPSLACSPFITWEQLNDTTAKATMRYKGTSGSGTFYFNAQGDCKKFSALRYMGNEPDAKRYEWLMQIQGYKTFEGITVPAQMSATWKLEQGDWTWLQLEVMDIQYNKSVHP